jgi:hypothetical protein
LRFWFAGIPPNETDNSNHEHHEQPEENSARTPALSGKTVMMAVRHEGIKPEACENFQPTNPKVKTPNSKLQPSREHSISKHPASFARYFPDDIGISRLVFEVSLELGCWGLELFAPGESTGAR